ncbi:MAG: class I SAM-dependent methyltransferase [Anaerolineales bacterium]|nr:class I SAM-dependent methyltransferase [Anaerolineales bacterium]
MPNNILFDLLGPIYDHVFGVKDTGVFDQPLHLPAEGWLLDLGGGTGRSSAGLDGKVEQIVVCDLSMPMLRKAAGNGHTHRVQASATDLPFAQSTFNRILVVDALHHMPEQRTTTGEMIRTLKPGGRLLIEEPDIRLFAVKLIALMEKVLLMKSHFHTPAEIKEMVESFGAQAKVDTDGRGSAWVMVKK